MAGPAQSSEFHPRGIITWRDVGDTLVRYKVLFLAVFAVTIASSIAAAFLMTPVYRSEILLVPAKEHRSGGGAAQLGSLRGLAGAAGISLPGGDGGMSEIGIEVLRSRGFLAEFIEKHQSLPDLFHEHWDNKISGWKPDKAPPTIDDGVELFRRRLMKIRSDGPGGTIRVAVDWHEREKAAEWANGLITQLNDRLRQRAIQDASNSLRYLQESLRDATVLETRQSIASLIEEQLNVLTMANIRQDYAFEVLDPAVAADTHRPQRPRPAIYVLLGAFAGIALASLAVAAATGLSRGSRRSPAQ
jgi:uncharacterized protein involved in exopolysaccharide biosynthesis